MCAAVAARKNCKERIIEQEVHGIFGMPTPAKGYFPEVCRKPDNHRLGQQLTGQEPTANEQIPAYRKFITINFGSVISSMA